MTYDLGRRLRPLRIACLVCGCVLAFTTLGCGGGATPSSTQAAAAALTASEKTHTGRASFYAARVARYRAAAAAQRQQAAAADGRAARASAAATTERIAKLKATYESHAVAAEQIAARIQTLADYHTTEASKEVGR